MRSRFIYKCGAKKRSFHRTIEINLYTKFHILSISPEIFKNKLEVLHLALSPTNFVQLAPRFLEYLSYKKY